VTVSEDGPPRGRFSADAESRAKLGDEAWNLKDQGRSLRTIAKMFTDRGDPVSHTTVAELISEAQDRARFLDFVGPAQSRATSIGRLDAALERQLATITELAVGASTGELDFEKGHSALDKAMARYVSLETLWVKVTGASMPTRLQVEDANGDPIGPNMAVLHELRKAVDKHAEKTKDMEKTDGLDG
jgi:hypothetical protein